MTLRAEAASDIVASFSRIGSPRVFRDGALIHGPDAPSDAFFWILDGHVRFSDVTLEGELIDFFTQGPGSGFGDVSLFSGLPPPHFAHAHGKTRLCRVEAKALRSVLASDAVLRDWLLHRFAVRLHDAFRMIDDAQRFGPEQRIYRYLRWLAANGPDEDSVVTITQSELANRLGLSRATVAASLRALRSKRRIKTGYRSIWVKPS